MWKAQTGIGGSRVQDGRSADFWIRKRLRHVVGSIEDMVAEKRLSKMSAHSVFLQVHDRRRSNTEWYVDRAASDPWLTEKQAAEILGLSPNALRSLRRRGDAPVYIRLPNGAIRYRPRALRNWIELEREFFNKAHLRLCRAVSAERRRLKKELSANRSRLRVRSTG
jgi:Helix-turn-helix domain